MQILPQRRAPGPALILDPAMFAIMLEQIDVDEMTQHSSINHHVDGMDYLCLSRTDALTVKLYLMDKPANPNGGFLVNPHSHRYAFGSIVLAGALEHLRFSCSLTGNANSRWQVYEYCAETGAKKAYGPRDLTESVEHCQVGATYFVDPSEVHTLRVDPAAPLLLGLVQFADQSEFSDLYLPAGDANMALPSSRRPRREEMLDMRFRAMELMRETVQ